MSLDYDLLFEKVFNLDTGQETAGIVKGLKNKLTSEKEFEAETYKEEADKEVIINYSTNWEENKVTRLCTAAGLINEQFDKAEKAYRSQVNEQGEDYKYILEGAGVGGACAQYAGIMSEGQVPNYQVQTYNELGIGNCLQFRGNEFLGYKLGLLQYLNYVLEGDNTLELIYRELIDERAIMYGNISSDYRREGGQKLKVDQMKQVLVKILTKRLSLSREKVKDLVAENFNPRLVERKMRLIDKHQQYQRQDREENFINYILSGNILARLMNHLGSTYAVDDGLKKIDKGIDQEIIQLLKRVDKEQIKDYLKPQSNLFYPFIYKKEEGHDQTTINRLEEKPKIGDVTSNLSYDYLQALVKDIILELHEKDEMIVTEIFAKCRRQNASYLLNLIKDRLRHSMKLRGRISEAEITYESSIRRENPDLFIEEDKIYPLDRAVLKQIKHRMFYNDLLKLWDWKLSGDGIFMILGTELEGEEESIEYHSSDSKLKFTNERKEIKLKLEQSSKNVIYGTLKQPSNYSLKRDTEYRYKEEEAYNFSSGQGVGFGLVTRQVDPDNKLKIEGKNIAKTYKQKKPEQANIGDRNTSLREEYYGDNIILRNARKSLGKLVGDLIYIYGPDKKNQLRIRGFVNGDYGINLKRKPKQKEEQDPPKNYTPHKVRFNKFEFEVLYRLEVEKSLYDHTRIIAVGQIDEDNWQEYRKKLSRDEPKVEINYHDDNRKILFKGYVNKHKLLYRNHEYYLKLEAISYTDILDRKSRTRIFQNQGTTYGDVFKVIEDKAKEEYDIKFNIVCDDSSLEDKPLVNKERPVVVQYRETDWEFLQRICSYLNKPIIIDDMKDTSETINILVGTHAASAKDLNNIKGRRKRKTVERPHTVYDYYKVEEYPHYKSDEIFNLGKPVYYVDYLRGANGGQKRELILIKNRIYVKQGLLYSDLTMAPEDKINIQRQERKQAFVGTAFRAEVKQVNNKHQAQVEFLDVYNQYKEDKAYWYAIDKLHTNAYFAPEVGDIVDVYFGSHQEKYGRIKSSSVVNGEKTDHPPHVKQVQVGENKIEIDGEKEKVRAAAGEEEKVYMDVTSEKIELANRDQCLSIESDKIKFANKKSKIELNEDGFIMQSGASKLAIDDEKAELKCGDKGITITDDKITMP